MARTGGKALREPLGDHGPKHLYRNIANAQGGRFGNLFTPEARRVERLQILDGDFRLADSGFHGNEQEAVEQIFT